MNPVANVLSTAEVLEMIMKNLDTKCILNCRLVNQFWDKTASSILKRKPAWIKVDASCDAFTRLYKCVSKSKDFPFPGIKLTSPSLHLANFKGYRFGRLTVNAPKYFSRFGNIHSHLDIDVTLPSDLDLIENVLAKLPNVKFLEFHKLSKGEANEELERGQFCMPKLTTLSLVGLCCGGSERVIRAIVNAAPSLENIRYVWHGLVPAIWEHSEKVKLVSSMILDDQMDESISQKLVANPPGLRVLSILRSKTYPVRQGGSITAIQAVFVGSQNTLQTLVLKGVCVNLDKVPIFEQLKLLEITTQQNQQERDICAMIGGLSSRCFPRLRKIMFDLESRGFAENFNSDHFDVGDQLDAVDVLELKNYFVPGVSEFLARKFPCVHHISVNYHELSYRTWHSEPCKLTYVWSLKAFPCLSKLEIRGFSWGSKEYAMDQFFTGIPNEICAKLRTVPKFQMDPFYNEILRPNGSLIHLKGLKEITLSLVTNRTGNDLTREKPIVSMVSVFYALELMPDLRMRFCSRPDMLPVLKRMLEPIQDYVTVGVCTEPGE